MKKLASAICVIILVVTLVGCGTSSNNETWYEDRVYVSDSGEYFLAELDEENVLTFKTYDSSGKLEFIWFVDASTGEKGTSDGESVVRYDWTDPFNDSKSGVWYYPDTDEVVRLNLKANLEIHYAYACTTEELSEIFSQPTEDSQTSDEPEVIDDTIRFECPDAEAGDTLIVITGLYSGADWVDMVIHHYDGSTLSMGFPYEEFTVNDDGSYTWSADYMDDPECTIEFTVSYGELIWNSDLMYSCYNGTYIQLPDVEE